MSEFSRQPLFEERRKSTRVPLRKSALTSLDGALWQTCELIDVSVDGAQILTGTIDPWDADKLCLRFKLNKEYEMEAIIVWHVAAAQWKQRIGLRFANMAPGVKSVLEEDISKF